MGKTLYEFTGAARTANGDATEDMGNGGSYQYNITGDFDGATMALFYQPAGHSEYLPILDADGIAITFTQAGSTEIDFADADTIKTTLSNAGANTSVTETLNQLENY